MAAALLAAAAPFALDAPVAAAFSISTSARALLPAFQATAPASDDAAARELRAAVRRALAGAAAAMPNPIEVAVTDKTPSWAILMSIEHERASHETLLALIRELPIESLSGREPKGWRVAPARTQRPPPANALVRIEKATLRGLARSLPADGAASESAAQDADWAERLASRADALRACARGGADDVSLDAFLVARFKVSNGEFLPFVEANAGSAPRFWVKVAGAAGASRWRLRIAWREIDMPWDWPVEVTLGEAEAFLAWISSSEANPSASSRAAAAPEGATAGVDPRGAARDGFRARLPTLAEHRALSLLEEDCNVPSSGEPCDAPFRAARWNSDFLWHSPCAVDASAPTASGVYDARGNVWEWVRDQALSSHIASSSFALVGGSWASNGDPATSTRYAADLRAALAVSAHAYGSFRYVHAKTFL
jgi:formylglycine-generating enzyme required for sulfatase activity